MSETVPASKPPIPSQDHRPPAPPDSVMKRVAAVEMEYGVRYTGYEHQDDVIGPCVGGDAHAKRVLSGMLLDGHDEAVEVQRVPGGEWHPVGGDAS